MDETEPIRDDVPENDAAEQLQPVVAEDSSTESVAQSTTPLEADTSDWQEQQQVVEDQDDDRR